MQYSFFEDEVTSRLLPLTYCRPSFDLRWGAFTPMERAKQMFGRDPETCFVRRYLSDVFSERTGIPVGETTIESSLFLNGRLHLTKSIVRMLTASFDTAVAYTVGNELAAVKFPNNGKGKASLFDALLHGEYDAFYKDVEVQELPATLVTYPWDIIHENGNALIADSELFALGTVSDTASLSTKAELIAPENIFIGKGCNIGAGVVIDASEGVVIIDDGASVMHQTVIAGPVYIGKKSKVRIGAKIYENTTVGPVCKVGGEVEGSILAGYANKQHDGFLGHSYLAQWTNLGADTNTSDLKNNYSTIKATLEGTQYETGTMFLGVIMADHSKCGINTMFNTGTSVGVGCNMYGGDFPPKYIPSFSWGGASGLQEYALEKFMETAASVMKRRDVLLTESERGLLQHIFTSTSHQRQYK